MATASRSREETDAKVQKFEGFLEEKLKPDLVHVVAQRDKALEEQKVFSDLSKNIKHLEQQKLRKLKSLVNLGSEVYAQAEVPDTSRIFVDIGLGFHVEFTWPEALQFISMKEASLAKQIEERTHQIANIKAQIKLVGEGIKELLNLSGG
ncbi:hypothetical protein GOP47_0025885 [Adiantum capillus-veneris]|uniref:Uncharacterized protein n=1 Tax=Adiantum capillus-veneris TaxID=13818 RepID=A0A9D4U3N1_ADICA|nr:hypothetical protein GOP47_0025885 [Adiantum capillus-veneris]